jgi:hypothetical protein
MTNDVSILVIWWSEVPLVFMSWFLLRYDWKIVAECVYWWPCLHTKRHHLGSDRVIHFGAIELWGVGQFLSVILYYNGSLSCYTCVIILKYTFQSWENNFLLFSGWDNISLVFKREGKTLELKLSVSCGSRTEDCTQFIFYWKTMVFIIHCIPQLFLRTSESCR